MLISTLKLIALSLSNPWGSFLTVSEFSTCGSSLFCLWIGALTYLNKTSSPPIPENWLAWFIFHVTSWIVISPDVSKPYIKTFICKYVCKALCWRVHHPVCRVCKNSMLQKDDFFCYRTLLFSSSAWNPLHGKNEAIWCCYLVFFTIISSASDYLSLVKKTNLIWEPESDASRKRCCMCFRWGKEFEMSEEREQKFHTDLMWLPSYPDLPVDRERKASCFSLQNRSMRRYLQSRWLE